MNEQTINELSFQLILHSGNARSCAMEAIKLQKDRETEQAKNKLREADQEFTEAHKFQTSLIQREADGEQLDIQVILIHAQDHLMTALTVKDMAQEIIELHQKIDQVNIS